MKHQNNGHYKIAVSVPPWSESKKSWHFLTIPGKTEGSWSQGVWFAKDKCVFNPAGFITLPTWYYDTIFRGKEKPKILNHQ